MGNDDFCNILVLRPHKFRTIELRKDGTCQNLIDDKDLKTTIKIYSGI